MHLPNDNSNNQHNSESDKETKEQFMALRRNVWIKLRELRHELKPKEYYLLEDICDWTVDWRRKFSEFDLKELSSYSRIGANKIYVILKSLEEKHLIIRSKSKKKGTMVLGLNTEVFGQILIDKHEQNDRSPERFKLVCVVDNTKTEEPEVYWDDAEREAAERVNTSPKSGPIETQESENLVPNEDYFSPKSGLNQSQIGTTLVPNRDKNYSQIFDNIREFHPSRPLSQTIFQNPRSKRKDGDENFSSQGNGENRIPFEKMSEDQAREFCRNLISNGFKTMS